MTAKLCSTVAGYMGSQHITLLYAMLRDDGALQRSEHLSLPEISASFSSAPDSKVLILAMAFAHINTSFTFARID